MRLAMDAHIGDGVEPHLGGGVHRAEVEEVQTIQEVFFDVTDAVLDAALFVTLGDVARGDVKSPMTCEIEVSRIEHRGFTDHALEYGRLQIVDHQARRNAVERGERVLVGGEEVLHGLRNSELDIHEPAVAQHHDEEGEPPARRSDANRAVFPPVELGALPGGKGELEECFPAHWAYLAHIVLEDRETTLKAFLAQALVDLLCAVRMGLQQAHDLCLERIESACTWRRLPRSELGALHPLGHRLRMHAEGAGDLRDGEPLALMAIADLAVGLIADHGVRPMAARSRSSLTAISSALNSRTSIRGGESRASTW